MSAARRLRRATWTAAVLAAHLAGALPRLVFSGRRGEALAGALSAAFERLGPAYVKFGQFLSVREDLMGPRAAEVFARLRDRARPLPFETVRRVAERELGGPLEGFFERFDPAPLAAASLSQVHRARLRDGSEVAVKVQRPLAAAQMAADLDLLCAAAAWLGRLGWMRRHVDLAGVVAEVRRSAGQELDFRREAEVAERFARAFRGETGLRIPRVRWALTTRRVLTAEYVEGRPVSDPSLRTLGGYPRLAEYGARLFFRQVLDHGLFHADLHPSNLLVTPTGEIAYLDFGIWGALDEGERHAVAGVLVGLVCRDATLALRHLGRLGVRVDPRRTGGFVAELERLFDEAARPTLAEVDLARIGRRILAAVRAHDVEVPHKYALLVKALLTIEGAARTLHAGFDPESAIRGYLDERFRGPIRAGGAAEAAWRGFLLGALGASLPPAGEISRPSA